MSFDVRIRLTPTERVQWEADTARIASKLGHLPYKHMILPAIHVFALLLDQRLSLVLSLARTFGKPEKILCKDTRDLLAAISELRKA